MVLDSKDSSTAISSKTGAARGFDQTPLYAQQKQAGLATMPACLFSLLMDSVASPQSMGSFSPVHLRPPATFTGGKHVHFRIVKK